MSPEENEDDAELPKPAVDATARRGESEARSGQRTSAKARRTRGEEQRTSWKAKNWLRPNWLDVHAIACCCLAFRCCDVLMMCWYFNYCCVCCWSIPRCCKHCVCGFSFASLASIALLRFVHALLFSSCFLPMLLHLLLLHHLLSLDLFMYCCFDFALSLWLLLVLMPSVNNS